MAISKRVRFEVFKRDSFKCQYCGRSAPDVILHADHILPKSEGGASDLMNLITACSDCNLGKSNKKLSDNTAVKKRKRQSDELQARREQIEMMMEWHRSLVRLDEEAQTILSDYWESMIAGYVLSDRGLKELRAHMRRYSVAEILTAMRASAEQYFVPDEEGNPNTESMSKGWQMIGRICKTRRMIKDKPYMTELFYIRGILRNRFTMYPMRMHEALLLLEEAHLDGVAVDDLSDSAKYSRSYSDFCEDVGTYRKAAQEQEPCPAAE